MASRRQNVPLSELLNGDDGGPPQHPHQEAVVYFPQQPRQEAAAYFSQQPRQEATAYFPQQPPEGATAYFPQQPQEATAYFPQQPRQEATAYFPQQPRQEASAYFPQQPHQGAVVGSRSPAWAAHRQAARREKAVEVVGIEQHPPAVRQVTYQSRGTSMHTTPSQIQSHPHGVGPQMHTATPQIQSHLHGVGPQMNIGTFQIKSHPHRAGPQPKKKKQWEWAPPVLSFEEWVKKQAEPAKKPTHLEQLIEFMCSEENLRRIGYRFRALRTIWGSGPLPESSLRGALIQINKDIYRWRANICQITAILGTSSMSDAAERNETLIGIFSERRRHLDDNVFADRWASYRHNMKMIDGLSFLGATRNSVLGLALLLPEEFDWTRGDKIAPDIGELGSIVKVPELLELAHELIPYVIWVLNGSSEGAPPPYKGIEVL